MVASSSALVSLRLPSSLPPADIARPRTDSRRRGEPGEEAVDGGFNFTNARRRSNSSGVPHNDINNFKTKFDVNEPEPVFEEDVHGAPPEDDDDSEDIHKTDSSVSENSSVDETKSAKDN